MRTSRWAGCSGQPTHQEPVEVHEGEQQKEGVEEEVEGDIGHRAQAAVARGIQDLEREPVEAEPEPAGGVVGWVGCGEKQEGGPTGPLSSTTRAHLSVAVHPRPPLSGEPLLPYLPCPTPLPHPGTALPPHRRSHFLSLPRPFPHWAHPLWSAPACAPAPFVPRPSPAEAEAEAAQVCSQGVQPVVGATAGLEVDIELGELQLHVTDVMQEEHEDAHVVVPGAGKRGRRRQRAGYTGTLPCTKAPEHSPLATPPGFPRAPSKPSWRTGHAHRHPQGQVSGNTQAVRAPGSPTWALTLPVSLPPGAPLKVPRQVSHLSDL